MNSILTHNHKQTFEATRYIKFDGINLLLLRRHFFTWSQIVGDRGVQVGG